MQKALTKMFSYSTLTLCLVSPKLSAQENYLYRYVNKDGVKVLDHSIPPEYAQKGYEVLSASGQLIKKVPAAPTGSELDKEKSEKALLERYAILLRRYSTIGDIERAKMRRLEDISTNILILRGNITSINLRIDELMTKAAKIERSGREVPAQLLVQLSDIRAELSVAQGRLDTRLREHEEVSSRYEQDAVTFTKGSKLLQSNTQLN